MYRRIILWPGWAAIYAWRVRLWPALPAQDAAHAAIVELQRDKDDLQQLANRQALEIQTLKAQLAAKPAVILFARRQPRPVAGCSEVPR